MNITFTGISDNGDSMYLIEKNGEVYDVCVCDGSVFAWGILLTRDEEQKIRGFHYRWESGVSSIV